MKDSLKDLLKSLVVAALLTFSTVESKAASGILSYPLAANTSSNLIAGQYIISAITLMNASTNAVTVDFFDSSNTTTTIVTAANTSYSGYATNFSIVFTNEQRVIITNSFAGWYTAPVVNAAATNTLPKVYTMVVPGSQALTVNDVNIGTIRGLTAIPNQDSTVVVTYRGNP